VFHALILAIFFSWIYLQRHTFLYTEDVNDAKDRTPIPDQSGEDHSGEIQPGEDQSGKDQFWDAMPPYESERHVQFWQQFQPLLIEYKPDCDSPILTKGSGAVPFKIKDAEERPMLLEMEKEDVGKMIAAHNGFVDVITNRSLLLHYAPGTRGIVSTAGGNYLPVLVISLRMLRRTGSKLPVEVFLAEPQEYEDYICQVVLPSLNARCVILSTVLNSVSGVAELKKYQLKAFAMLFSSFEEILFLDADSFPLHQPEEIFATEPFQSYHMVTWPDFWASTASPLYYHIASQEVPPMSLRQSTESGEVFISKKTHSNTLFLCSYYNYWGPTHYYSLFSQGAPGEGDKETFLAAAIVFNQTFYQVSEPICAIGHSLSSGGLAGSAMVQFDPSQDHSLIQQGEWRINGSTVSQPRPFFVHANFPKFNPATVFTEQAVNPAFEEDGETYTRAWTIPNETIHALGPDLEKHFWTEIMWTACELENKFQTWTDTRDICGGVRRYWKAIFGPDSDPSV
jgi:alpha 1,2-mannosyltransferase